jgi:lipopolysaccharide biosynthesis protein
MSLKLRRAYIRVTSDIIPGVLNKLGRRPDQPQGRERPAADEWSMAVPFRYAAKASAERVAVICHLFHADLAETMIGALSSAHLHADLFVSTDTDAKAAIIRKAAENWKGGKATVRIVENRGRDIAPKLVTFADVYDRYPLILFLHSKRSGHYDFGREWREYLQACLAGSQAVVQSIQEIFELRPDIGMVVPAHYHLLRKAQGGFRWDGNFRKARRLAWKMDIDLSQKGIVDFPSGSMFWARPAALKPLLGLKLAYTDFPAEPCWVDGTLAHCIERLFLFSCEKAGLGWVKVISEDVAIPEQQRVIISEPSQIDDFIAKHRFDLLGIQAN